MLIIYTVSIIAREAIGDRYFRGGAAGTRTPDLLNAIEMRSQLRYSPI